MHGLAHLEGTLSTQKGCTELLVITTNADEICELTLFVTWNDLVNDGVD